MVSTTALTMRTKINGFSYLGLLMIVAISSIGMAAVGSVWSFESQRQKEQSLLAIGKAYQTAIDSYYHSFPAAKTYPKSIDDLLSDKRSGQLKRHLRKAYLDPMTRDGQWMLIKQGKFLLGVSSQSNLPVIKPSLFNIRHVSGAAPQYSDIKFAIGRVNNQQKSTNDPANASLLNTQTGSEDDSNANATSTSSPNPASNNSQSGNKVSQAVLDRVEQYNQWLEEQLNLLREKHQ